MSTIELESCTFTFVDESLTFACSSVIVSSELMLVVTNNTSSLVTIIIVLPTRYTVPLVNAFDNTELSSENGVTISTESMSSAEVFSVVSLISAFVIVLFELSIAVVFSVVERIDSSVFVCTALLSPILVLSLSVILNLLVVVSTIITIDVLLIVVSIGIAALLTLAERVA
jgi:hypothetical protein